MTEASTPQPSPSSEQLPWGIAYLREDIQDLRQDLRDNTQGLRQEIQEVNQNLRQEIQGVRQEMREDIQGLRQELRQEIRSLSDHLDSRFKWTITTVIAFGGLMVALSGVIIAMIRL